MVYYSFIWVIFYSYTFTSSVFYSLLCIVYFLIFPIGAGPSTAKRFRSNELSVVRSRLSRAFFSLRTADNSLFIGCSSGGNSIVGSWTDKDGKIICEFFSDGSCNVERLGYRSNSTTYKVSESGKLTLYDMYDYPWGPLDYVVQGNKLFLGNGKIDTSRDNYYRRK